MNQPSTKFGQSIYSICSKATLWTFLASGIFAAILATALVFLELRALRTNEEGHLQGISSQIAHSVAGELMVGDDRALQALMRDLKVRHNLRNLSLTDQADACDQSINPFSRAACYSYAIPAGADVPRKYVLLSSVSEWPSASRLFKYLLVAILPVLTFGFFFTRRMKRVFDKSIVRPLESFARDPEGWIPTDGAAKETMALHSKVKQYIQERNKECERSEKSRVEASLVRQAAQVAHDIRSPLSALLAIAENLEPLPEEHRRLVRNAVNRINDIANSLVDRTKSDSKVSPKTPALLSSTIEEILSEKRLQFSSRLGLTLCFDQCSDGYGLFVAVDPVEFKRVLSNLINNAAESIAGRGDITLKIEREDQSVRISIKDTGKGIDPALTHFLLSTERSNNPLGRGLGIPHARGFAKAFNGTLDIQSQLRAGTTVVLRLPLACPPSTFLESLNVTGIRTVVVVDDDPSVHDIWKSRFQSDSVNLLHVTDPKSLRDVVQRVSVSSSLFLVDYEYRNSSTNGLELISKLNLTPQSVLVTSHYEDAEIVAGCLKAKVKLIPKSMAGFVPIRFSKQVPTETHANA